MWTPTTRKQHSRDHLRYGSDLTDAEWEILAMNAIFYVLRAGCPWRMLPKDFPPRSTVYGWFLHFRRDFLFETINHHLVHERPRAGRPAGLALGGGDR